MASLQVGRVCMKVAGRESGGYCVFLKSEGPSFGLVTGPKILTGVKRRKSNVSHLEPTQYMVDVSENSTDEQVIAALDKAGLTKKFGLKMPSAAQMKARAAKDQAKAEAKPVEGGKKEAKAKKEKK
ncbi:MAG: 50S ribosomal protein L14e [Candidatus Aenigmarchaeota archaeon]|nr:50S ribosomal protein L14e [Candidatus Aenigmarchaeota archaeon]